MFKTAKDKGKPLEILSMKLRLQVISDDLLLKKRSTTVTYFHETYSFIR